MWQIDLDQDSQSDDLTLLSEQEQARALRFVFQRDRRRYVSAHVALRRVLAQQTGLSPSTLVFTQGNAGKPALANLDPGPRFNLTHSGALAIVALHPTDEIGVDVELVRTLSEMQAVARAHFDQDECEAIAQLADDARDRAFMTCWTRKEACLKAVGVGLAVDTRSFHVGVEPDARTVRLPTSLGAGSVALDSFMVGPAGCGAVARLCSEASLPAYKTPARPCGVFA